MIRLTNIIIAAIAAAFIGQSTQFAQAAGYVDVFQANLVSKCAGRTERDAALCLDNIVKSIKQEQKNLKEFPAVLNDIRGPFTSGAETYGGCTAAAVNGNRPKRKPGGVAAGPACSVEWNNYRAAIGKLMHETCVTKEVYHESKLLEGWRLDAEKAENDYDRCFNERLAIVHINFSRDWEVSNGVDFFRVYKKAVTAYKSNNLDGQLQAAFNACKAAVQSYQRKDARNAKKLIASGVCQ